MKVRLTRFSPVRTAWTSAILHLLVGIIVWILMLISVALVRPEAVDEVRPMVGVWIALPILVIAVPIASFIWTIVGVWIYNLVAKWTGGVEFTLKPLKAE